MNKIKVLMISGKRQSGKDTTGNFLIKNSSELFQGKTESRLEYKDEFVGGQKLVSYEIPFCVKKYAFADELKKTCSELFGFPLELCYTEEGKNTLTEILWQNWPGCYEIKFMDGDSNFMKVREILQFFGTEFMRKLNPNCWRDKCVNLIRKDKPDLACIVDWRFPGEDLSIFPEFEVKKIRLTRDINDPNDKISKHSSEIALDNYKFDAVIENHRMAENQSNQVVAKLLKEWKWAK